MKLKTVQLIQKTIQHLLGHRSAAEAQGAAKGHILHHRHVHLVGNGFLCRICVLGVVRGKRLFNDLQHGRHHGSCAGVCHQIHENGVHCVVLFDPHSGGDIHGSTHVDVPGGLPHFNRKLACLDVPVVNLGVPVGEGALVQCEGHILAFPGLVFALAVAAALGGGVHNAIIALGAISWPKYARVARSETLAQKETVYLRAAKLSGCGTWKLIFKHILPNITGPILVTAMLDIGTMMMELAGLSFLGLGAKPPVAEWGSMMSDTRNLLTTHPWVTLAPGCAIFVSVMIFNLLGDTVRDWLDPRNGR